jgi:hypothetical protein
MSAVGVIGVIVNNTSESATAVTREASRIRNRPVHEPVHKLFSVDSD